MGSCVCDFCIVCLLNVSILYLTWEALVGLLCKKCYTNKFYIYFLLYAGGGGGQKQSHLAGCHSIRVITSMSSWRCPSQLLKTTSDRMEISQFPLGHAKWLYGYTSTRRLYHLCRVEDEKEMAPNDKISFEGLYWYTHLNCAPALQGSTNERSFFFFFCHFK